MFNLTKEQYENSERNQTLHRTLNTLLSVAVLVLGLFFVQAKLTPLYEQVSGITQEKAIKSEIVQIVSDEGYRRCVYKDSRGLDTVGFGHLMTKDDNFKCIDTHHAVALLRKDYQEAKEDVERRYPWAEDDVQLVLINMTFNMGSTRLSKFHKTLNHMKKEEWDKAAGEVLDSAYARQVPRRASMIAARLMRLGG